MATVHLNSLGQPIGFSIPGWSELEPPPRSPMEGRYCRLEPLDPDRHAAELFAANAEDREGRNWTYLPYGPFGDFEEYRLWVEQACRGDDPLFFAIRAPGSGGAFGVAAYLRIDTSIGSIEVGAINLSPRLQRTPAATEAMFLMMQRAFDELGYRRYEWKCDTLNEPSKNAARRLGFVFEGVFRQATIYKGRNRDTAWYSITDQEWPNIKKAYIDWLDPRNFDATGQQKCSLSSFRIA